MTYAKKEETEFPIRKETPFEKWLNCELDKVAPDRFEMGSSDGIAELLEQIWIEKGRP